MNNKNKKTSGKELTKLNKRKKFYTKLDSFLNRMEENELIFLNMNKSFIFPEYDELSKMIKKKLDSFTEINEEIKISDSKSIVLVYYEEVEFLIQKHQSGVIEICRRETHLTDEGDIRKGVQSSDKDYNYQKAFNWAIKIIKKEELEKILEKEKLNPSEYDLTPPPFVRTEPFYYKSRKPPRRRRR